MKNYLIGLCGAWLVADGINSILAYIDEQSCTGRKQSWKYDHAVRLIRTGIGIALIVIGYQKEAQDG